MKEIKRIAMISSYPPYRSGIANYCKNLVGELKNLCDINVVRWNYDSFFGKLCAPIKRSEELKFVLKEYDVVHVQYHFAEFLFLFLPLLCWLPRKGKLVLTLHEDYFNLGWFVVAWHNLFYRCADVLITHTVDHKLKLAKGLQERSKVVPMGCLVEDWKGVTLKDVKYVLLIGFINKWKGYEDVIKAFSLVKDEFPDVWLYVVGRAHDRNYFEELKVCAEEVVGDRVVFVEDFISDNEYKSYI